MADPVRLLLVANFADRVGGGEESLLLLARGLDRRQYDPYAMVPGEGQVAGALRRLEIPVVILPLPPFRPWTAVAATRTLRQASRFLAERRPLLVHAHGSRGALYVGLAARRFHIPVIWHVRIAHRDRLLDRLLLSLSSRVIAISHAVGTRFGGSRHSSKVRVVYNGVEPADWTPEEGAPRSSSAPMVLQVGRLSPDKGQATLLRAAPLLLGHIPAIRFVLLGADALGEASRLRRLAFQLGVNHALEIRDWMEDPRPVFQEADVVTLPSRSEGFGRVLVEAACLAKPVVATHVGGIPEVVVDGETGLLIPPDNPLALAEALLKLLREPDLRRKLGTAARRRALARFTARHHVEGVEAVYAELAHAQTKPAGVRQ